MSSAPALSFNETSLLRPRLRHRAKRSAHVLCCALFLLAAGFTAGAQTPQAAAKPDAPAAKSKAALPTSAAKNPPPKQTAQQPAPAPVVPAATSQTPAALPQSLPLPHLPHAEHDNWLIHVFCAMAVILVLYPIGRFLLKQWSFRKEKLLGALVGDAVVYYYKQFRAGAAVVREHPPVEEDQEDGSKFQKCLSSTYLAAFKKDFSRWYGRRYYIAPVLMLTVLTAVSAWWADEMLRAWASNGTGPGADLRALVASALAGAFVWVVSDELDRLRRRDFTTSDVYYYVFRILLAIPFAWALSAASVDGKVLGVPVVIPLAFFLGAFPTGTLFTIARRFGSQTLKLGDDQVSGVLELEKLQSIGKTNAERFKDEGIATISALAYADPIDLTIRTNFDFSYVVDGISQALAWIYFGANEKYSDLLGLSLRGAQEIAYVIAEANDKTDADKNALALKAIDEAAADLKIPPNAFRSSLDQIAEDPYTKFLVDVWS